MPASDLPANSDKPSEFEVADAGDGIRLVALRTTLDAAGVDRVGTRFLAAVSAAGARSIVDLSGTDFIASLGLRLLISAARAANGKRARFVLFGARRPVATVLEQSAMGSIVGIAHEKSEAIALLQA